MTSAVLRVLTFNLWFEPLAMAPRMKAIGQIIERTRPAVIGFQEVTDESLRMLKSQSWARFYDCSLDVAPPFSTAYYVVLFSALPVVSLETFPFANSGMGRELVCMKVQVAKDQHLVVGTSHLESLPQFGRIRTDQLKTSLKLIDERVTSDAKCLGGLFIGDTNLFRADLRFLDPSAKVEEDVREEKAKSSRSKCHICSQIIKKDMMRVGTQVPMQLPNGTTVQTTHWHHKECYDAHKRNKTPKSPPKKSTSESSTAPSAKSNLLLEIRKEATRQRSEETTIDRASRGLPPNWMDLWLSVDGNTEENGFTYDGERNGLVSNRAYRSRFDRMLFMAGKANPFDSSRGKGFLISIEMVGTEPIAEKLWASDHFGLLATFKVETG